MPSHGFLFDPLIDTIPINLHYSCVTDSYKIYLYCKQRILKRILFKIINIVIHSIILTCMVYLMFKILGGKAVPKEGDKLGAGNSISQESIEIA